MPRAASSSSWYAARASRAIRAPDTSPRSDIRAWHNEIACCARPPATRGTVPGRRPMDPNRRRKKDFCAGEFMRFETAAEACSFNVSTILARPVRQCRIRPRRNCAEPRQIPMPLSEAERKQCVETLLNADKTKKQAVQLSTTYPHITIEDSYAISTAVAQHKIKGGAKLIGHKVGLTSKAMQASSQINEPDYGHLLETMMIPDGAKVAHADYCLPRVEVELAFVLGKPLKGPGVNLLDVLRATEYVV